MQTIPVTEGDIPALIKSINALTAVMDRALHLGLLNCEVREVAHGKAFIATGDQKPATIENTVKELIIAKQNANRSAIYITYLGIVLRRFAKTHAGMAITEVTTQTIEKFLSKQKAPRSRKVVRAYLSVLFAFSVRRGYRKDNPVTRVETVSIDPNVPLVLTPAQVETLLSNCPAPIMPYLVLATFAGLRPMEIVSRYRHLNWESVNLEAKTVAVIGKRRRRMVPLEPRAVELLSKHSDREGPVCPPYHATTTWMREKAAPLLGWKTWPPDALRHTAASYLLALHQDCGKVSTRLGNSPDILMRHYLNLVSQEDCRAFWKI
jgi:integrase